MKLGQFITALAFAAVAGCTSYSWQSSVPEAYRTIAVPVFENRTNSAELGPITTQYALREFQREGTFKIDTVGNTALEVQGVIVSANRNALSYDRSYGMRAKEYRYVVTAEISLVDKIAGKVLIENMKISAETTFMVQGDLLTGQRNAAQRIAAELGRQIVDEALAYPYNRPASGKGTGAVEGRQVTVTKSK